MRIQDKYSMRSKGIISMIVVILFVISSGASIIHRIGNQENYMDCRTQDAGKYLNNISHVNVVPVPSTYPYLNLDSYSYGVFSSQYVKTQKLKLNTGMDMLGLIRQPFQTIYPKSPYNITLVHRQSSNYGSYKYVDFSCGKRKYHVMEKYPNRIYDNSLDEIYLVYGNEKCN